MIYTLKEYKEEAIKAERYTFASKYAVAAPETAKVLLNIHNALVERLENDDEFVELLYKDYLKEQGI